jgi:hypothetical protein
MLAIDLHRYPPAGDEDMGWHQCISSSDAMLLESNQSVLDWFALCAEECAALQHCGDGLGSDIVADVVRMERVIRCLTELDGVKCPIDGRQVDKVEIGALSSSAYQVIYGVCRFLIRRPLVSRKEKWKKDKRGCAGDSALGRMPVRRNTKSMKNDQGQPTSRNHTVGV